jgi:hypothetical protein
MVNYTDEEKNNLPVYFHRDTDRYVTWGKYLLGLLLPSAFVGLTAAMMIAFLQLREFVKHGTLIWMLLLLFGTCGVAVLTAFAVYIIVQRNVRRQARYTYFHIAQYELVFSCYGGERIRLNRREIHRVLYVIPLEKLESVGETAAGGVKLIGEIHEYRQQSDLLLYNYRLGKLEFECAYNNYGGYTIRKHLTLPPIFARQQLLLPAIEHALQRDDEQKERTATSREAARFHQEMRELAEQLAKLRRKER